VLDRRVVGMKQKEKKTESRTWVLLRCPMSSIRKKCEQYYYLKGGERVSK